MPDEKSGGAPVPPAGGPYVPPPESSAPPTSAPASVSSQGVPQAQVPPAQTPLPPPAQVTPPAATPPATPPVTPPGTPEGLLTNLEALKPTVESLKVPDGYEYPKDFLTEIAKSSSTVDEAQKRFDTAHTLRTAMESSLLAKNKEWIQSLQNDPEVGKDKWEASVNLFKQGVVEEFGMDFAKRLANSKIDAEPNFFKAVVRRMRAKNPQPVPQTPAAGAPVEKPTTMADVAKEVYKKSMVTVPPGQPQPTGPRY